MVLRPRKGNLIVDSISNARLRVVHLRNTRAILAHSHDQQIGLATAVQQQVRLDLLRVRLVVPALVVQAVLDILLRPDPVDGQVHQLNGHRSDELPRSKRNQPGQSQFRLRSLSRIWPNYYRHRLTKLSGD